LFASGQSPGQAEVVDALNAVARDGQHSNADQFVFKRRGVEMRIRSFEQIIVALSQQFIVSGGDELFQSRQAVIGEEDAGMPRPERPQDIVRRGRQGWLGCLRLHHQARQK
jgi:hypothetical protein